MNGLEAIVPAASMRLALAIAAGSSAGSLALVSAVLAWLPSDHFSATRVPRPAAPRHPARRIARRVGKNLLGGLLFVAGFIMALPGVPGQGILTMVVALVFIDFPGKARFEKAVLGHPRFLRAANKIRRRLGRPAFEA